MTNTPDPSIYRDRENQVIEHVERLLGDERLRLPTSIGRRPITTLRRDVVREDREVDLKRMMANAGRFDRDLQAHMPVGRKLTITLARRQLFFFQQILGRLKVVCLSPWRDLLDDRPPAPLDVPDLKQALAEHATIPLSARGPTTLVIASTCGFTAAARALGKEFAQINLILTEPNEAGGWKITAADRLQPAADLFDPELDADKRQRIRAHIENHKAELLSGGVSAKHVAEATSLPLRLVEDELAAYAEEGEGMAARRLGEDVVLFRDGSVPAAPLAGGSKMAFIQRLRALFSGKADNETKISLLSERRAALGIQRDRGYEEMGILEQKEGELREQFKATTSTITRRRIASQLVQLRKDLERRQQLLGVLNQQMNVISTHLHNLELVQQGQSAQLPDSEELASDAAAAEEVLAELQANSEMAGSVAVSATGSLSEEEQAVYEELEREASGAPAKQPPQATPPITQRTPPSAAPEAPEVEPPQAQARPQRQRGEAEPG